MNLYSLSCRKLHITYNVIIFILHHQHGMIDSSGNAIWSLVVLGNA